jgi:ABC-type nickel/cobalt efflux system permease component RcnA
MTLPVLALYMLSASGGYTQLLGWVYEQQRNWQQSVSTSLSGIGGEAALTSTIALVVGSFFYGFFHAVGPGHGKVIMTTYLLSNREQTQRALGLTFAASLLQALVAIALVYGLVLLVGVTMRDSTAAARWSERLSYALVIAMGLWLIYRALKPRFSAWLNTQKSAQVAHGHDHSHHKHDHAHQPYAHHDQAHHEDHHGHHHEHDEHCGCGHNHGPTSEQLKEPSDWKTSLGIILSIGLRPCTGAILVLVLANSLGLVWAGVLAALAMAMGTFLAIGMLALLTVKARSHAEKIFADGSGTSWRWAVDSVAVAGGAFLCFVGTGLLLASFAARSPFGI